MTENTIPQTTAAAAAESPGAVYFVGAGGIGMSALVRYFLHAGYTVGGYDRTETPLTRALVEEGALIHYTDSVSLIPQACLDPTRTLVVYTPAIPDSHSELQHFRTHGFDIQKRAQVLGTLTRRMRGLCVAGTHGKTTTTSMAAHLLHQSHVGCNAFLGGITKNYGTNYLIKPQSADPAADCVVIEADEFDRSFHHLRPYATVVTATDADHLDIYGTEEAYLESFAHYTSLIQPGGYLIQHTGLKMQARPRQGVTVWSYSRNAGDFHAEHERIGGGRILFDLVSPLGHIADIELGVPVSINIENGIAAIALAQIAGATPDEIRQAMRTFAGVERRFDFKLRDDRHVFLSDYAHHPEEIRHSVESIREVFTGRRITGIFQPHLYTRTRDFYREFAEALSGLDDLILLDIYPARELPIPGVTSDVIRRELRPSMPCRMARKEDLPAIVEGEDFDVLMLIGAGDADDYCPQLTQIIQAK